MLFRKWFLGMHFKTFRNALYPFRYNSVLIINSIYISKPIVTTIAILFNYSN